jgi:hypothetical protein
MYDSVNPNGIPAGGQLICGWVDGAYGPRDPYGWTAGAWARFPGQIPVRIAALSSTRGAQVYDVENGDLTPEQAIAVLDRERAAGNNPTIYGSQYTVGQVKALLAARSEPPWWVADPTGIEHMLPGAVATQWLWKPGYDQSLVADFWPGIDEGDNMPLSADDLSKITLIVQEQIANAAPGIVAAVASDLTHLEENLYNGQYRPWLKAIGDAVHAVEPKV